MTKFIGHTKKVGDQIVIQSLKDHLLNTKNNCEVLGQELNLSHLTGLAGLLHDMGKLQKEVQEYLVASVKEEKHAVKGRIDHASMGALFLRNYITEILPKEKNEEYMTLLRVGDVVENAIFSHHNYFGLKDYLNSDLKSPYVERIKRSEKQFIQSGKLQSATKLFFKNIYSKDKFVAYFKIAVNEYRTFLQKIEATTVNIKEQVHFLGETQYFISEFIYSCLIDADRSDAASFEEGKKVKYEYNEELFHQYYLKLVYKLKKMNSSKASILNKRRAQISEFCDRAAEKQDGIYTLSAATGAGKTLASLRYAIKHADLYHKKHIIYVLPYITIIEQNAAVMRKILNDNENDSTNILEFHSNISENLKQKNTENTNILDLGEDSWDSPIIVTTMVQFLNVIFAASTKNRRRFHNLCNSVIIFDEIQKIPIKCLYMFNKSCNFLQQFGKSDLLLCTATQPALDEVQSKLNLTNNHEIIPNLIKHEQEFKRVTFVDKTRKTNGQDNILTTKDAAKLIFEQSKIDKSILGIFNTVKSTVNIFKEIKKLQENGYRVPIYYLSTQMCPAERKDKIDEILGLAKAKKQVICISTPLIEAGVDVSFECVFRSLTGLDSIVQAAGRCNRNNEFDRGKVILLNMDESEENITPLKEVYEGKRQVIELLSENINVNDFLNVDIIKKYYQSFFSLPEIRSDMNYPDKDKGHEIKLINYIDGIAQAMEIVETGKAIPPITQYSGSETVAHHFQVIEDQTVAVLAPYQNGSNLIAELNGQIDDKTILFDLLKRAQLYIVNLYQNQFNQLLNDGAIYVLKQIGDATIYAFTPQAYQKLVTGFDYNTSSCIF